MNSLRTTPTAHPSPTSPEDSISSTASSQLVFWDPEVMTPLLRRFQELHVVTREGRRKHVTIPPENREEIRRVWSEMYEPLNGLIFNVLKRKAPEFITDEDVVAEMHIKCRDVAVKYLKHPPKEDDKKVNHFSYLYSSMSTMVIDLRAKNRRYKRGLSLFDMTLPGDSYGPAFEQFPEDCNDVQNLEEEWGTKPWAEEIDRELLLDYVEQVDAAPRALEVAIGMAQATFTVIDEGLNETSNFFYKVLSVMRKRYVAFSVCNEDVQLARLVLFEAFEHYKADHLRGSSPVVFGENGLIRAAGTYQ